MKKTFTRVGVLALSLVPLLASADGISSAFSDTNTIPEIGQYETLRGIITGLMLNLANYTFSILVALSVFFVLYAAFLYLTAGGEEESVTKANHIIRYAAIAVGVAVLAKALPLLVQSLFYLPSH